MEGLLLGLAGGALIGVAAAALWLFSGRVAGISGIAGGFFSPRRGDIGWRVLFLAGLAAGGVLSARLWPHAFAGDLGLPTLTLVVAGLLVGFGTGRANGCTSGHGVCGVARLSPRSLVATATFLTTAIATLFVVRHVIGVGS
jgi:uncharacterized protein